ncbi:RNA polymerase sigma factor [Thermodesulfobacteriota bacterium]
MKKNEEILISDILAGDVDAYAILVKRYQKPIYNLVLRICRSESDAFDLTQETFIRAYEKLERFNPSRRFFPWLYTMGLNLARDHFRKTRSKMALEEQLLEGHHNPHSKSAENNGLPDILDAAKVRISMEKLAFEYREAIIMRFHEEMSMSEIAQALGISVSGAKMRVHRGLLKLRKLVLRGRPHEE